MADVHTGNDNLAQAVDSTSPKGMESLSQSVTKLGDTGQPGNAANAENTSKLVSTSILPDTVILDDADRPATGKGSMSSKATEQAAADLAQVVKDSDPQTLGDNAAAAINKSVQAGANLTELILDLNKDLANPRFPKAQHATFKTDESGQESILIKPGLFGGQNFKVQADSTVTIGDTNR